MNLDGELAVAVGYALRKHGPQTHIADGTGPDQYAHLRHRATEECERSFHVGHGTWAVVLEEEVYEALAEDNVDRLRAELLQVAAVAIRWVTAIDERGAQ